jgi:hypothetical protein
MKKIYVFLTIVVLLSGCSTTDNKSKDKLPVRPDPVINKPENKDQALAILSNYLWVVNDLASNSASGVRAKELKTECSTEKGVFSANKIVNAYKEDYLKIWVNKCYKELIAYQVVLAGKFKLPGWNQTDLYKNSKNIIYGFGNFSSEIKSLLFVDEKKAIIIPPVTVTEVIETPTEVVATPTVVDNTNEKSKDQLLRNLKAELVFTKIMINDLTKNQGSLDKKVEIILKKQLRLEKEISKLEQEQ